jgi:hypothetical protein
MFATTVVQRVAYCVGVYYMHGTVRSLCNMSQGIRIIQSNTSFLLLKYTYIQGYMFQLRGAINRPLP